MKKETKEFLDDVKKRRMDEIDSALKDLKEL